MSHRPRHINCAEAVSRLYEYLDREVSEASLEEVDQHLDECRRCCDRFAFERLLWMRVREEGRGEKCPEELKVKVRALIQNF